MTEEKEYIVLPDLDKKLDEAIHDAINFFEKKCPYCDSLLFTGHIRNKIQIDHFIPITKGGQHVPWNILPVCQKCNAKKLAKVPKLFLDIAKYQKCEEYLSLVQKKYIGQIQLDLEKYQQIKTLFSKPNILSDIRQSRSEILKSIFEIINGSPLVPISSSYKSVLNIEVLLEETINKLYKIPTGFDEVNKYSATEIYNIIQPLHNFPIPKFLLSKIFKRMGFYYKLERLDAHLTKRVFHVTPK
jgi:hypothetical protein